jgi:hypothetical protein
MGWIKYTYLYGFRSWVEAPYVRMDGAPPHLSQAQAIRSHFPRLDQHHTMIMTEAGTEITN